MQWKIGIRNGDTDTKERQKQKRQMPEVLIITPESLHLLLAQKGQAEMFQTLRIIAIDEWHELIGSKRGVQVELAVASCILCELRPANCELCRSMEYQRPSETSTRQKMSFSTHWVIKKQSSSAPKCKSRSMWNQSFRMRSKHFLGPVTSASSSHTNSFPSLKPAEHR